MEKLGGALPFRTRDTDAETEKLLEESRRQTAREIKGYLAGARFAAPAGAGAVPAVPGDNLHHGRRIALYCPASLYFLAGHQSGVKLGDLQKTSIALSFLEKRAREGNLMATWGLLLVEQHLGVADKFMSSSPASMPAAGAPVFADALQSRTAHGLAFAGLLEQYDALCAGLCGGADWRKLREDAKAMLEMATFCLDESLRSAVRYRGVVREMEKSYRLPNDRLPAKKYRELCHRMAHGNTGIPPEITKRISRPWKGRFEVWGEETKRNRKIVAETKQWLAALA